MPLTATRDAHAYVCGKPYSVKKGDTLDDKPEQLKAALLSAGVARKTSKEAKE